MTMTIGQYLRQLSKITQCRPQTCDESNTLSNISDEQLNKMYKLHRRSNTFLVNYLNQPYRCELSFFQIMILF